MDQTPGAGHHAVTHMAVHQLFQSGLADDKGLINGKTEQQYFDKLDHWQHHADRIVDAHTVLGPTTYPGWFSGSAQREHSMADPHKDGPTNLQIDRDFVVGELDRAHAAHAAGKPDLEMKHLGAALHALEDSYSEAHVWRDAKVYSGDPTAPVQSINVFDPGGLSTHEPLKHPEGTHDPEFDKVPVDKDGNAILPAHQAAAKAGAEMLHTYAQTREKDPQTAHAESKATVDKFFQPSPDGVRVNDKLTDAWKHEHDHRLEQTHKVEADFHNQPSPGQPAPAQPATPPAAKPEDRPPTDAGVPGGVSQQTQGAGTPQEQANGAEQPTDQQTTGQQAHAGDGAGDAEAATAQGAANDQTAGSVSLTYDSDAQTTALAYASDAQDNHLTTLTYESDVHDNQLTNLTYGSDLHDNDVANLTYDSDSQDGGSTTTTLAAQDHGTTALTYTSDTHASDGASGTANDSLHPQATDTTGANTGDD